MTESFDNYSRSQQRDLVLASNEFCFLQSKTNGIIKTYTGPITMTISAQETLVIFDSKTKQFKETSDFSEAKQLFVSAPENWYIVLKNPAISGEHPETGKAVAAPNLEVGKKVNIAGPTTFSLYPGQMAKVVLGHRLRSNQYLLARVYDADAAKQSTSTIVDAEGKVVENSQEYFSGQLLVIKGTDVSFYIPPTGIEVIPVGGRGDTYVRDAVTLERLEYCILKDENGTKRYIHGPEVVFPSPTESFVARKNDHYIFKAIELSPISGVYVKVIADYTDEKGVDHKTGEELFITGNEQMIYYPRPEHAMISYDNKIMHHAIAIPKGEGRYIMNRLTGEIATKVGPLMYLPDPRTEVVVKRKLTPSQCKLWYPGNTEVLLYNESLSEKSVEKTVKKNALDEIKYSCSNNASFNYTTTTLNSVMTLNDIESNGSVSRGTSYTKPRTITLDNKFDGVVSIDVWTGYAVNVISKNGDRKVILGPQTILLDYDQTLDALTLSTGKPKNTDNTISTVFLRYQNNKVSDLVNIETKDFVKAQIKISYCVDFLLEDKDKWFAVDNYIKYMCDKQRSAMKREAKKYTIEEFYQNYNDIIRNVAIDNISTDKNNKKKDRVGRYFSENGMLVYDAEVLAIAIEKDYSSIIENHQKEVVEKSIELAGIEKTMEVTRQLIKSEKEKVDLEQSQKLHKIELDQEETKRKLEATKTINEIQQAIKAAEKEAEKNLQTIIDEISNAKLEREKKVREAQYDETVRYSNIKIKEQEKYADTIKSIIEAVGPDLVAALSARANADLTEAIASSLSPYALAGDNESAADVVNKLLRGTPLSDVISGVTAVTN